MIVLLVTKSNKQWRHLWGGAYPGIDGGGVFTFISSLSLPPLLSPFSSPSLPFPWHHYPFFPFPIPCPSPTSFPLSPLLLPFPSPPLPLEVGHLNQLGGLGSAVSSPARFGAEPRPKSNLVHSRAVIKPLVAIILSILTCMFCSRSITI